MQFGCPSGRRMFADAREIVTFALFLVGPQGRGRADAQRRQGGIRFERYQVQQICAEARDVEAGLCWLTLNA